MGAKKKKKGKGRSWLANRQRTGEGGAQATPGKVSAASDRTFKELVLRSPEPVLVDFWAEWCGPCKQVGPMVEELARDFAGRARMVKVDVDKNPKLSSRFSIRSIPTLMVFKDGEPQQTLVGAQGKRELTAAVEAALG
jgi:thioredoxin 1